MKRDHLYVKRSNPLVWLSAVCMLASAVSGAMNGFKGWGWITAASIVYAMIVLLSGDELLHRTAVPVWILGVCFAAGFRTVWGWIVCPAFCICFTVIISGRINKLWLLICCLAAAGAAAWVPDLPLILAAAGLVLLYPAVRVHNDGKYHPTWGDRVDGRRVRTAPAMEQITAYFMPNRNGANNLFAESVEITELERYVRRKRREGLKQFGMTHVIMAAYVRTVAKYPALNRFLCLRTQAPCRRDQGRRGRGAQVPGSEI